MGFCFCLVVVDKMNVCLSIRVDSQLYRIYKARVDTFHTWFKRREFFILYFTIKCCNRVGLEWVLLDIISLAKH